MPTVEFDVEVWCATCGDGLCNQTRSDRKGLHVEVCGKCLGIKDNECCDLTWEKEQLEKKITELESRIDELEREGQNG